MFMKIIFIYFKIDHNDFTDNAYISQYIIIFKNFYYFIKIFYVIFVINMLISDLNEKQ